MPPKQQQSKQPKARAPSAKPKAKPRPPRRVKEAVSTPAGARAVQRVAGMGMSSGNASSSQLGDNRLLNNMVSASRCVAPTGVPDLQTDLSTAVTLKIVKEIYSTIPNEPFSIIVAPNPATMLRITQGDVASNDRSYAAEWAFQPGFQGTVLPSSAFSGNANTSRDSMGSGPDSWYGGLPSNSFNVRLRTNDEDGRSNGIVNCVTNGKAYGFIEHSGSNDHPTLYLGASNAAREFKLLQTVITYAAATTRVPGVSIYGFTSLTGPGTLVATAATFTTSDGGTTWVSTGFDSTACNYPFVSFNVTGGSNPNIRQNSILTVSTLFDVKAANANGYTSYSVPNYSTIQELCEDYRPVGGEIFVTDMSDALNDGGAIAVSGRADVDIITTVNYGLVAGLISAFDTKRKNGCWDFWRPPETGNRPWRPFNETLDDGFIVAAGTFGGVGGHMRVEAHFTFEFRTTAQILAPRPSRVHPSEILEVAHILSALRVTGCANEDHESWRKHIQEFGNLVTKYSAEILRGTVTAAELFVKWAPVAATALALL